ncbi:MAG: hypothetical protein ACFCD0_02135 [Gemmataceae bacterium]
MRIFIPMAIVFFIPAAPVALSAGWIGASAKILYRPTTSPTHDTRTHWEKDPVHAKLALIDNSGMKKRIFRQKDALVFVVTMTTRRQRIIQFTDAPSRVLGIGYGIRLHNKTTDKPYEFMLPVLWHYKLDMRQKKPFHKKPFQFSWPNQLKPNPFGIVPQGQRHSPFDRTKGWEARRHRAVEAWKNRLTTLPVGKYEAIYDQRVIAYDPGAKQEKVLRLRSAPLSFEIRR